MKCIRFLALLAIVPASGWAQRFTFGVEGGVPAQNPVGGSTSKLPFAVGPTVTVRFFSRLSLESGVLFYRLGERTDNFTLLFPESALSIGSNKWHAKALEIPFLAKYHFLSESHTWRPFLTAGPAVRRTSIDYTRTSSTLSGNSFLYLGQPVVKNNSVKWNVDPVVGDGVSFRTGKIYLEPQVRYSYWGAGKNSVVQKNQVQFLMGLRF
jgi:hypothetical protein